MYLIYKHTNSISGKAYIGYTKSTIDKRWKSHLNRSRHGKYNWKFDNALRYYPVDSWTHEVLLENIPTLKIAHQKEIDMIVTHNTLNNSYNSKPGGQGGDFKEKTINKMKTRIPWNKGLKGVKVPWNKGKPFSKEIREKMSKNHNHVGMTGKKHSEESKKKMSLAKKTK